MVYRDNAHRCPRCDVIFDETRTRVGHRFETCTKCGGNWVDMLTLRDMLQRIVPGRGVPFMRRRADADPGIRCPICDEPMDKVMLKQLELDWCRDHGIWFDEEQLTEALRRYASSQ